MANGRPGSVKLSSCARSTKARSSVSPSSSTFSAVTPKPTVTSPGRSAAQTLSLARKTAGGRCSAADARAFRRPWRRPPTSSGPCSPAICSASHHMPPLSRPPEFNLAASASSRRIAAARSRSTRTYTASGSSAAKPCSGVALGVSASSPRSAHS